MKNYSSFRWFLTSGKKLVVGGKNAEQNDILLNSVVNSKKERIIMHTASPGSPFCVIEEDIKKVHKEDIRECAVFCGCFSQEWKKIKKTAEIHIFSSSQIYKAQNMKQGTWGVRGKVKLVKVFLELTILKQRGVYRAVPKFNNEKHITILPGKIDKTSTIEHLRRLLGDASKDELVRALPAGGFLIK